MNWIGIDPGLTGALAMIQGTPTGNALLLFYDLPMMAKGSGGRQQLNPAALAAWLRPFAKAGELAAVIETQAARPGQGVVGVFSLGDSYGAIRGVLATLGLGYELVPAGQWKRAYGLTSDKELSRARAIELYPEAAPYLELKRHHGRAEALLLADWLRRRRRRAQPPESST